MDGSSSIITAAELVRRKASGLKIHQSSGSKDSDVKSGDDSALPDGKPLSTGLSKSKRNAISDVFDELQIEETIRKLEAQLHSYDNESDKASDDEIEDDVDNDSNARSEPVKTFKSEHNGNTVVSSPPTKNISIKKEQPYVITSLMLQNERIESLPTQYLPRNKRRKLKGIDDNNGSTSKHVIGRNLNESNRSVAKDDTSDANIRSAVKKILGSYKPRSHERLPFYCRCCSVQMDSEQAFQKHKLTVFHATAVEMERKASFCKLCRKQCTSVAQLKEHLNSEPHKRLLDYVKHNRKIEPLKKLQQQPQKRST